MSNISEKAHVSPNAKIGKNVTISPFAYIEDDVVIGDDCVIYPYVSIMNGTRMDAATACSKTLCSVPNRRISTTVAMPHSSS